jgi:hypothetical protein
LEKLMLSTLAIATFSTDSGSLVQTFFWGSIWCLIAGIPAYVATGFWIRNESVILRGVVAFAGSVLSFLLITNILTWIGQIQAPVTAAVNQSFGTLGGGGVSAGASPEMLGHLDSLVTTSEPSGLAIVALGAVVAFLLTDLSKAFWPAEKAVVLQSY